MKLTKSWLKHYIKTRLSFLWKYYITILTMWFVHGFVTASYVILFIVKAFKLWFPTSILFDQLIYCFQHHNTRMETLTSKMASLVMSYNHSYCIKNQTTIQKDQYLSLETSIFLFAICCTVPIIFFIIKFCSICCNLPSDRIPSTTISSVVSDDDNQDAINDVNIWK